jgi:hypothetical protein
MFADEGRRDFALVFTSSWGCAQRYERGNVWIK